MSVTATGVRRKAPGSPPRSQRQDADAQNPPALALARALKAADVLPMPDFIEPALATLVDKPPKGER
jgi:hypothetical protein